MRSMVEEMYQEFKKGRGEDTSTSKQDKGTNEPLLDGHFEGKGKGKEPPLSTPPSIPLIKLDVKFSFPIYDGELNVEKLDNWIRQIDVYFRVKKIDLERIKIQVASLRLRQTALVWWEGRTQADLKHGKILSTWNEFVSAIKK